MSMFKHMWGSKEVSPQEYLDLEREQIAQHIAEQKKYEHALQIDRTKFAYAAQQAAQQRGLQQGALGGLGAQQSPPWAQNQAAQAPTPKKRFDPNEHEAFQVSMSQLVTLWQAKFGDKWFDAQGLRQEDFWDHAFDRLRRAEKMEGYDGWFRLKEEA